MLRTLNMTYSKQNAAFNKHEGLRNSLYAMIYFSLVHFFLAPYMNQACI